MAKKKYSKDYALGYVSALNHTKLALQDLVGMIETIENEILANDKKDENTKEEK